MKKVTGKQLKTGLAVILVLATVICYSMGIGRDTGTEVRALSPDTTMSAYDAEAPETSMRKPENPEDTAAGDATARNAAVVKDATTGDTAATDTTTKDEALQDSTAEEGPRIYVHVCGAVKSPGVYRLEEGSRSYDAVEAAGGFEEGAAEDVLNLAQPLTDGQRLYVPNREETAGMELWESPAMTKAAENGRVNINTASGEELMTLSGIGEARAEAILAYRREAGPFLVIEDIMKVPGIKEAAFQKIKDDITV